MKRLVTISCLTFAFFSAPWLHRSFGDETTRSSTPTTPPPTHENLAYGPYERNLLDLWVPDSDEPVPLLVFIHGGGFRQGSKDSIRRRRDVQHALDHGVAFASIQYRLRPIPPLGTKDPQRTGINNILRDSARAIQYLRYHADDMGLDKTRIACYGSSAGAGTSSWLAFHDDLADPENDDPVLRESTRISAAGVLDGQYTYDIEQWSREFNGVDATNFYPPGVTLFSFFGLGSEEEYRSDKGRRLRADVDMHAMISSDDPPIFVIANTEDEPLTSRRIYNHHPHHAELIETKCREMGVDVLCLIPKVRPADAQRLNREPDVMFEFFYQHLGVAN